MKRKIRTILGLAFAVPGVLYITGILAQFIINIRAWKAAGGDYQLSPGLP